MASHARPSRLEDIRIAIICALPREYDAVVLVSDEIWTNDEHQVGSRSQDYNIYRTGRIGSHEVVLMLLPNMGTVSASSATASLRGIYTGLQLAILTGICGGVPSPMTSSEILLGDVVISKSVVQYDLGRQYPGKFSRKDNIDDDLGRPNKDIRTLLATFETRLGLNELQDRTTSILNQLQRTAIETNNPASYNRPQEDKLFEPEYPHIHRDQSGCGCSESSICDRAISASCEELQCDIRHQVIRRRLEPIRKRKLGEEGCLTDNPEFRIHVGRFGSGNTVIKSGEHRDRVAREHGIVAFEMEGAGVWDEIPCVIVKAVCDYADSHKNKKWQDFAAATAASATKALLERYPTRHTPRTACTRFVVPYNENPDFVGRLGTLEHLKQQFGHGQRQASVNRPRSRVALYGLGGIGKTQIALAYVYSLKETHPNISVFWVHASNTQRFRQDYASIAEECEIPGRDDPKVDKLLLVKKWLERRERGQWLMVIDNADETQLFFQTQEGPKEAENNLGRYIPQCNHGSILITTRNKQTGLRLAPGRPLTKVERMTDSEADQLLRLMLEETDYEVSKEETLLLSSRLEHLPLALAQAAAFIHENEISIKQYVRLLDESDLQLVEYLSKSFEAVGRDSDTPHAVTATWIISFEQIEKQNALASNVLSLISFFDRQAIPRELIANYYIQLQLQDSKSKDSAEAIAVEVLGTLKAFSFVTEAKDKSVDVHRLVQLVTQKWLFNKHRVAEFAQQALKTVSDAYPPNGRHETQEVCRNYLPHAYAVLKGEGTGSQDEKKTRATLLQSLTSYLLYLGNFKEAEKRVSQAVELRKQVLGEEHFDTLTSMDSLASAYRSQGQWVEAEEIGVRVMEARKKGLGDEHPETLRSVSNLALTMSYQGRWVDAKELEVWVVETRKKVLGEKHPDTLVSMANLASTYRDQGQWKEAEELAIQVVETRKIVLGEEHPSTLLSIGNLASTYWNQGRWKEAEKLDVWVMETSLRVLGEEHPSTLTTIGNLSITYWDQGRWKEAEELGVRVMEIRKRVLGEEHPSTLLSTSNLATTYRDQGRWKEAEKLDSWVVETRKKILGEEHPDTLRSIGNLASTYRVQNRWKEAEELEVGVMEARKRVLGEEHLDTLRSIGNLALTYRNQGRWKEAEDLQANGLKVCVRLLGEEHPETLRSTNNLASIYQVQGRWKEAEEMQVQVVATRKRTLGEEHPDTLQSMNDLAFNWKDQNRWEDAIQLMRDCARCREKRLGLEHPGTQASLSALANWENAQGKSKQD